MNLAVSDWLSIAGLGAALAAVYGLSFIPAKHALTVVTATSIVLIGVISPAGLGLLALEAAHAQTPAERAIAPAQAQDEKSGPAEVPAGSGVDEKGGAPVSKPARAPARQVPVEPFDDPGRADAAEPRADGKTGPTPVHTEKKPAESSPAPAGKDKTPRGAAKTPAGEADRKSGGITGRAMPEPPLRKPRKPIVSAKPERKKSRNDPPGFRSARDRKLCKALQSCRNAFIRCKGKIKYPDQSKEWSIAKEECGAHYKTCVEKDFQPGQWFFTRWFYFQELKCE